MSLINANIAIPINAAIAANVLSNNATTYADAVQGPNQLTFVVPQSERGAARPSPALRS